MPENGITYPELVEICASEDDYIKYRNSNLDVSPTKQREEERLSHRFTRASATSSPTKDFRTKTLKGMRPEKEFTNVYVNRVEVFGTEEDEERDDRGGLFCGLCVRPRDKDKDKDKGK